MVVRLRPELTFDVNASSCRRITGRSARDTRRTRTRFRTTGAVVLGADSECASYFSQVWLREDWPERWQRSPRSSPLSPYAAPHSPSGRHSPKSIRARRLRAAERSHLVLRAGLIGVLRAYRIRVLSDARRHPPHGFSGRVTGSNRDQTSHFARSVRKKLAFRPICGTARDTLLAGGSSRPRQRRPCTSQSLGGSRSP